jgi:hypothetical protein
MAKGGISESQAPRLVSRSVPARLFVSIFASMLPAAAISQQTVDGLLAALEIGSRSSYVPDAPLAPDPPFSGDARPETLRATHLELPVWMK